MADSLSLSGTLPLTAFLCVKAAKISVMLTPTLSSVMMLILFQHVTQMQRCCVLKPEMQVNSHLNGDRKGQSFDIHTVISKKFKGQNQRHDPAVVQCSRNTKQL